VSRVRDAASGRRPDPREARLGKPSPISASSPIATIDGAIFPTGVAPSP
jgi:hypothetical protein